jgi:hypothetical protein
MLEILALRNIIITAAMVMLSREAYYVYGFYGLLL